jgi:hypothetical protein
MGWNSQDGMDFIDIYCMCDAVSLCIVLSFNSSFATPSGHLSILIRGRLMFRKLVLLAITLLIGIITLGGCSSSSPESSYAGILVINEKKYYWQGSIENGTFTIGEKIGEVQKAVEKDVMPKDNFSSNFLEVGTEIFSSNEDNKVIIVKRKNGKYGKLTESDYYKNK